MKDYSLLRTHRKVNPFREIILSYVTNVISKIYEKPIYISLICQDTLLTLNTDQNVINVTNINNVQSKRNPVTMYKLSFSYKRTFCKTS